MKLRILAIAILLSVTSLATSAQAQQPTPVSPTITQTPVTQDQLADACIQNRAETLPIPFSDVSPKDWAFKAVMTMYYCGAFRQAAPRSLFRQSTPSQS